MATLEQWVNLEKDAAYTNDGDGATLERCGHVTIQVRFKKNGIPIGYKVNVTSVGNNNVQYNVKELRRNPNFRQMKRTRGITNSAEIRLDDVRLPAAGGNTYRIEARDDKGNVVSTTASLITKRKM